MRKCLNCDKELTGKQMKYCSVECTNKHYQVVHKERINERKKEYRDAHKEEIKIYNKQYNQENRDVLIVKKKDSYRKNIDKIKKYNEENRDRAKEYYLDNKERIVKRVRENYGDNREKILKKCKVYYQNNKMKINEYRRKWGENNKEKTRKWSRKYLKERRKDPLFRLNTNISSSIRSALKTRKLSKGGRHWEGIAGYTVQDLKEHLEKQFTKGMSWSNMGDWHIDHILPKSFFEYKTTDDVEFKMCWRLENLQPLWAKENLSKNNKIIDKYFRRQL